MSAIYKGDQNYSGKLKYGLLGLTLLWTLQDHYQQMQYQLVVSWQDLQNH